MSQRVDSNGKPAIGWLLYLFAANSSTPVTAYQDTALTVALPVPIVADSSGMMPPFWLADGSYRARGTNADGSIVYFDLPSLLALGASAGAAPAGGVDPNAIFSTGDSLFMPVAGTRAGWVRDNARTIGSATSGATERANADCQALFEFYWNTYSDTFAPVLTGRGLSAAADWSANKQITTLDMRGVSAIGLDDMGNSAASRFTSVPFVSGNATTAGSICGENTHALTSGENGPHQHSAFIDDPGHHHGVPMASSTAGGVTFPGNGANNAGTPINTNNATTGVRVKSSSGGSADDLTASAGSGTAHNTVSRSITGTWYRRL